MKRLLLYFSYIGTNYKGLQRIRSNDPISRTAPDLRSIQGILEFGLGKVLQIDYVSLFLSSRTDTGVHALETTAQFDVDEKVFRKKPYSPEQVCQSLNLFLEKNECDIRIKRVVEVLNDFSCRRAYSRVYEFRVAVLNQDPHNITSFVRLSSTTEIRDLNRCEVVCQPFDVKLVQDACKLFIGKWDFSTFMKSSREDITPEHCVKSVLRFSLSPEILPDIDQQAWSSSSTGLDHRPYDIYVFTVEGSGFLRRQVRRMVGALVAVGRGIISPTDIVWMLKNPSEKNWTPKISTLGPNGLYLKQVNYPHVEVLRGYLS